jgi:hypothetical protein
MVQGSNFSSAGAKDIISKKMLNKKKLHNYAIAQHESHPFHIVDPSP